MTFEMIFYQILLIFIDFLLDFHVFLKVFCLRSIELHRNVIENLFLSEKLVFSLISYSFFYIILLYSAEIKEFCGSL